MFESPKGVIMFRTIVWATDGSELADSALPLVTELARANGSKIVVFHANELFRGSRLSGGPILAGAGNDVVSLLGGDTADPNGTVYVDCGAGVDLVVINPARRGTYRGCEYFADQWHEADWGALLRPSPEVFPAGLEPARAARAPSFAHAARIRASDFGVAPVTAAEPDGGTGPSSISAGGGRVGFSSDAGNLIEKDTNAERTDPFVRDFASGTTLVADSVRHGLAVYGGRFRRGPSGGLSADGRFAVFTSRSSDLGRSGSGYRIWIRDLQTGSTEQACKPGNDAAESPVISADGRHVAFESRATNLSGSDTNQQTDVYWCDLNTGESRRVSSPLTDGVNTSGTSLDPSISFDGRYVAFTSDAGGLVAGDGLRAGVYWKDMQSGEIRQVDTDGIGEHPRISADGRYVVFDSETGVFRKDMVGGEIQGVTDGANGVSTADSVSADGNLVALSSTASNLVEGDTNGTTDVFVRNMATGAITRVSTRADGGQLSGPSYAPAISADGRYVAFGSYASNLVPGTPTTRRTCSCGTW